MRKLFLQTPPENGAITNYTSEVARLLRPALPDQRANEIIREAQAHLTDQAEALKARENLSQNEAEARAVAAFTPPRAFARAMTRSAFETRFSHAWHKTGKTATVLLLCGWMIYFLMDGAVFISSLRFFNWLAFDALPYLLLLPTLGVCLCALLARRAQTRFLLCAFTLVAVLIFVHNGFFFVMSPGFGDVEPSPVSRLRTQQLQRIHAKYPKQSVQADYDIQRLQAGLQTYGQENPTVPVLLRGGRGYLVPYAINPGAVLAKPGAKDGFYHEPFARPSPFVKAVDQTPNDTVLTVSQARMRWLQDGLAYLAQARYEKKRELHYEKAMPTALQQTGFSASSGWSFVPDTLRGGLLLILLDWFFAKLGCAVDIKRRARRERKMAQA